MMTREEFLDKVVIRLVNKKNTKGLVSRPFMGDIAITYCIDESASAGGPMAAVVSIELAKKQGVKEEDMYEAAIQNTRHLNNFKAYTQIGFLEKITNNNVPQLMRDVHTSMNPGVDLHDLKAVNSFVITNDYVWNGSSALVDKMFLGNVTMQLGGYGYYILPGSVNELQCFCDNKFDGDVDRLRRTLKEGNEKLTRPDDVLSYTVFHYSVEKGLEVIE